MRISSVSCLAMGALIMTACDTAHAQIVALGARDTYAVSGLTPAIDHGVPPDQAWPAQLEALLRTRGYRVNVTNAGIAGDTTARMLSRLDRDVPAGTRIVVYEIPFRNDWLGGIDRAQNAANVQLIQSQLHARGVRTVLIDDAILKAAPRQNDARHGMPLSAEGHAQVARRILPQVVATLGSGRQ
jgi:acyl-CoA thioesterase I